MKNITNFVFLNFHEISGAFLRIFTPWFSKVLTPCNSMNIDFQEKL